MHADISGASQVAGGHSLSMTLRCGEAGGSVQRGWSRNGAWWCLLLRGVGGSAVIGLLGVS
ncbi:MAG: hypothetical protein EBT00_07795 [Proteobacteria bacterium]|nr:hypothetical protein [Pseudomonadota bacterium]